MLKESLTIAISAIAFSYIVGCSNQAPVSVSVDKNTPVEQALLSDVFLKDISSVNGQIWGVHKTDVATQNGDNYLYFFKPSTESWVRTDHWGKRVAVTKTGKCYHFNSYNTIWCCKMLNNTTDSSGYVTSSPESKTIRDISAGYLYDDWDVIWIVCTDNSVYKGYVQNNRFIAWITTPNSRYSPVNAIGADPYNGGIAYIGTDGDGSASSGVEKYDGSSWVVITTTHSPITDVAYCNGNLFYKYYEFLLYRHVNDRPRIVEEDCSSGGMSVDLSKCTFLFGNCRPTDVMLY